MKTRIGKVARAMPRNLKRTGTTVGLSWTEYSGGAADPVTGQVTGGTATARTGTAKAWVHSAEAKRQMRQWGEIQTGDMIVDFKAAEALDGKAGLRFTINGEVYEQVKVGGQLAQMWDTTLAGRKVLRTVLLRKAA